MPDYVFIKKMRIMSRLPIGGSRKFSFEFQAAFRGLGVKRLKMSREL
jgi:hypothetical protein